MHVWQKEAFEDIHISQLSTFQLNIPRITEFWYVWFASITELMTKSKVVSLFISGASMDIVKFVESKEIQLGADEPFLYIIMYAISVVSFKEHVTSILI